MTDGGDLRRLVLKTLTFILQTPFIISPEAEDVNTSVPTEPVTSSTTTGAFSTSNSTEPTSTTTTPPGIIFIFEPSWQHFFESYPFQQEITYFFPLPFYMHIATCFLVNALHELVSIHFSLDSQAWYWLQSVAAQPHNCTSAAPPNISDILQP